MNQMPDIPVNDIAPLVEVNDYSIYLLIGMVAAVGIVGVTSVFFGLKKWRGRRLSERAQAYQMLKAVDLSDPKRAAYRISEIGRRFAYDNERTERAYQNLFERLEAYKYALNVQPIDEETLGYYRLYLEIIDV
ncbi:MAG: hypothetical protein PHW64_01875 [Sulfuricurvum sp.]|nr:hypothetical protein [Sulfuricurvum sp.]